MIYNRYTKTVFHGLILIAISSIFSNPNSTTMKYIVLLVLAITTFSCFNGAQYMNEVGDITNSETATIYVINPTFNIGLASENKIYIDGLLIGEIGRNTHIETVVAIGEGREVSIKTSARPGSDYEFNVDPNSIHYFEYHDDPSLNARTIPVLRKLSEEDGKLLLSQVPEEVRYKPKK